MMASDKRPCQTLQIIIGGVFQNPFLLFFFVSFAVFVKINSSSNNKRISITPQAKHTHIYPKTKLTPSIKKIGS